MERKRIWGEEDGEKEEEEERRVEEDGEKGEEEIEVRMKMEVDESDGNQQKGARQRVG